MRGRIEVGWPRVDGRNVTVPVVASGSAVDRIVREDFWCEYDFDPAEVPAQILAVPVVANLLAVAWLEDLELRVATLDRSFYEAVPVMKAAWGEMFSNLDLGGTLEAEQVIETDQEGVDGRAIALFSGGLDSLATALLHAESDLTLYTFWGLDVSIDDVASWAATWSGTERYASRIGASASWVRTNLRGYLDTRELARRYKATLAPWEDAISGITLLGMAAPVAVHRGASVVYIPGTQTADMRAPIGTHPTIDDTVRFADAVCVHSGFELDRVQKARLVLASTPDEQWLVCPTGTGRGGS